MVRAATRPIQHHSPVEFAVALVPPVSHARWARASLGWSVLVTGVLGVFGGLAAAAVWPDAENGAPTGDLMLVAPCLVVMALCWVTALGAFTRAAARGVGADWRYCLTHFPSSLYATLVTLVVVGVPGAGAGWCTWTLWGPSVALWWVSAQTAVFLPWMLPALAGATRIPSDGVGFSLTAVAREPGYRAACAVVLMIAPTVWWVTPGGHAVLATYVAMLVVALVLCWFTSTLLRYRGTLRRYPD
ncbi:hypothetical protein [Corynebacterium sp. AOP12-C2-36]|uniref:hypothetical protein n=1 Tax=Corynebacterium sp. AOP12-C2-36 TaxID=3457723 RepID=UPI004033E135